MSKHKRSARMECSVSTTSETHYWPAGSGRICECGSETRQPICDGAPLVNDVDVVSRTYFSE